MFQFGNVMPDRNSSPLDPVDDERGGGYLKVHLVPVPAGNLKRFANDRGAFQRSSTGKLFRADRNTAGVANIQVLVGDIPEVSLQLHAVSPDCAGIGVENIPFLVIDDHRVFHAFDNRAQLLYPILSIFFLFLDLMQ